MTKQEAKRILHEKYNKTPIYPYVVKQFREYEGDWEEFVKKWEQSYTRKRQGFEGTCKENEQVGGRMKKYWIFFSAMFSFLMFVNDLQKLWLLLSEKEDMK